MILLGATPAGRHTEQHDIFFGIADTLKHLVPHMIAVWPEAKGEIHIDAWREVNVVDGYTIKVIERKKNIFNGDKNARLFFLNLGGYKQDEFEEYHYKMLAAAENKGEAIKKAKATAFYKHTGFKGASSHIDDKYGVDVDDVFEIEDILSIETKEKYSIVITKGENNVEDKINLGYLRLEKL
jgi:hypothetical protein